MHDEFEQLKPNLDNSLFNKNPFNKDSEQKIINKLNELHNQKHQKRKRIAFKPTIALVALLSICSFLIFLVIQGEGGSNQPTSTKQPQSEQYQAPTTNDEDSDDQSVESVVKKIDEEEVVDEEPPPEKGLNGKEELYQLMLNNQSVFKTVNATYKIQHNGTVNPITYHLAARVRDNPAFYIHELSKDGLDEERLYKDNQIVSLYHLTKEFSVTKNIEYLPTEILDFEYVFPKNEAISYLEDFSQWAIKERTQYLNLDTVVIEGELGRSGHLFNIWVHEPSGIWLKFRISDEQGTILRDMEMEKLKLNTQLEHDTFTLSIPSDYFGEGQEHNGDESVKDLYKAYEKIGDQYQDKNEVQDVEMFGEFKYVRLTLKADSEFVTIDQYHKYGADILDQLDELDPPYVDDHRLGLVLKTKDGSKKIDGYYDSDKEEFIIVESNE
ncbi:hypothetical protein ACSVDE_14870 [Pseudalkalibacillus sp. Hm43]|uniref:hypothetical protein n=1 Tax=Pseudalkalibacillus sp. Hm43 TaxID=3450742 RepID=UPI003F41CE15